MNVSKIMNTNLIMGRAKASILREIVIAYIITSTKPLIWISPESKMKLIILFINTVNITGDVIM